MRTIAFWLSLVVLFTFPWEDMVILPGLGSLSRVVGLSAAAFWVATVVVTGRLRKLRPFHIIILLFVLWNTASIAWTKDPVRTFDRVESYVQLLGLSLMLWDLMITPANLRAGLQAYVLGAYVGVISIVYNYANGIEAYNFAHGRYSATNTNPNEFGLILALGLPLAWYLATSPGQGKKSHLVTLLNLAFIPLAFYSITLTASRGSLAASLPGFLFMLASMTRLKPSHRILIVVTLVSALLFLIPRIPAASIERFGTTGSYNNPDEFDLNGRVDIWAQGLDTFMEHPLIGVGSNAYRAAIEIGRAPHNTHLSVLVELGLIGYGLFAGVIFSTVYLAFQQPKQVTGLWLTILVIWLTGTLVHNWEHTKHTWLLFSLVAIGANLTITKVEAKPSPAAYRADKLVDQPALPLTS
jgi:O-antigen ligase